MKKEIYEGTCVICQRKFKSSFQRTKTCPEHRHEWKLRIRRENSKRWYAEHRKVIVQ